MFNGKINRCKLPASQVLMTLSFACLYLSCFSQQDSAYRHDSVPVAHLTLLDTPYKKYHGPLTSFPDDTLKIKKRFWRAAGELMLTEVVPWSYNYFIRDAEFAKISWESIGHNLQFKNWEWDDNSFTTNQFAHPYHGNLYYNSFRTNGYSFWQSVPAAFAGSYIWEVAGETHPPAPNDFINTSVGGITLGEMTYRLSNMVVDNRQGGFNRQMREVFAFLINPLNGFNRIIDGRWGRYNVNIPERVPSEFISDLEFGMRRISTHTKEVFTKGENQVYGRFSLLYGNPYTDLNKPFDNFSVNMELGNDDSATINAVSVNGFLTGWKLRDDARTTHVTNLTTNYDFFHNSAFQYGGQSVNFNWLSHYNKGKRSNIYTKLGAGIILLGAVPDEYLYYGEGRNYDYGPGLSFTADGLYTYSNKLWLHMRYRGGWFITVNGNESNHLITTISGEARYFIYKNLSLGLEGGYLNLKQDYKNYEDVSKSYPIVRLSVSHRFRL